ncbi:hypothetical protein EXIGLDRAFT_836020 [Exidia glandulosa HHB12029]|uniref:Uncharacterized protein n=1 Tax=Exidia glandulosa HHB12029 TaxID=1314781 RepID=A0A165I7S0_EXIGL|nr:hypothetical protein EXIGLDRAFT_836020 [Exidia glandulosa HHB12029]
MAHELADELVKEILAPPLFVSDELFADTGPISPFSKATYSAADVLLVCKRWMRVATPALYHTVVIRSTAQANALAAALKRNPDFGRYIKKLRLEGAYGDRLKILATTSPDISDFCMSLAIWADSGITGLTKVMSAINPRRVVLTTAVSAYENSTNKKRTEVIAKLCSCIPIWTNLETFSFSGSSGVESPEMLKHFAIAEALSKATSLRAVHIWFGEWPNAIWQSTSRGFLETLASNTGVQCFHVHPVISYRGMDASLKTETPAYMLSRAVVWSPHATTPPHGVEITLDDSNPFYVPMANVPEAMRHQIWSKVFDFAVSGPTAPTVPKYRYLSWYDEDYFDLMAARSLILTSHAFAAIVIPLLCCHLRPMSEAAVGTVIQYMQKYSVKGSTVFSLELPTTQQATPLIRSLTQLRVCRVMASSTYLTQLALTSGPTLQRLILVGISRDDGGAAFSPHLLFPFTAVTTLCLDYSSTTSRWRTYKLSRSPPTTALENVTRLEINSGDLLNALALFSLPKVTHFICGPVPLKEKSELFVERHGSKLREVKIQYASDIELDRCSSLETLELSQTWGKSIDVPLPNGHPILRRLKLHWPPNLGFGRSKRPHWNILFERLTRARFPSLQEVHLLTDPGRNDTGIWPATEHDIKKSQWPKYSETLATEGITLFDHTGRSWRPRLASRR